ncbi:MAG: DNA repair protein RecN [Proteobacteria bacterium]|nr:DNA repair protein RecN [Pseudomonadota bacterium]
MLSLITVRNYAVIDAVEVEFDAGLSVLTGDTGAGKSILVDALGLALGDRADAGAVRKGCTEAQIGVQFECPRDHPALDWLTERGLDRDRTCLLRRVVSARGRSRAFVNSQPATLQDLRSVGSRLVNIHGQGAHQALLHAPAQRRIVDHHGGHLELTAQVAAAFGDWKSCEKAYEARRQRGADRASELELLRFQVRELEDLDFRKAELEALQEERGRLANVDRLSNSVESALRLLYERDHGSAQELVARAQRELSDAGALDPSLGDAADLLEEAEIQIQEAVRGLTGYRDRLEPDPERLDWVELRLATIRSLALRHHVEEAELGDLLETLRSRIDALGNAAESLEAARQRARQARDTYFGSAEELSAARQSCAASLSDAVETQMAVLGLPKGRFRAEIGKKPQDRADATGLDRIEFQVSLNPGQEFGPLSRVASGGELSRISLALEVVAAGATSIPTLVFDEVDAGIGGGVAEIVGRRLADIAAHRQVLCVTHLAQVASQGRQHYRVLKSAQNESTRTGVQSLSRDERVEELARMLGGVEITERTRAHAEEMIDRATARS